MAAAYNIFPLGDSAITIDFGNSINLDINKAVIYYCEVIKAANLTGVKDIIPAYSSLTVYYDVITVAKHYKSNAAFAIMKQEMEALLQHKKVIAEPGVRKLHIPVCYAAKYALDAEAIALFCGLSFDEIVQIHTYKTYRVYMVGFLPGFAYMGEVDERIAMPRRKEPRIAIKAGSVGIAGKQTGIYPLTSPGGWQTIGRTPLKLFDKDSESPTLFKAGDEVTFFSITEDEFASY